MGCVSSGPAKITADSVLNSVNKECEAVEEFGKSTKEKILTEVHNVNEVLGSAVKSVENEVLSVTTSASKFLSLRDHEKTETVPSEANAVENAYEAISDTETVIMSDTGHSSNETEHVEEMKDGSINLEDSTKKQEINNTEDENLHVEDIEHLDNIEEHISNVKESAHSVKEAYLFSEEETVPFDSPKKLKQEQKEEN